MDEDDTPAGGDRPDTAPTTDVAETPGPVYVGVANPRRIRL